MGRMTVALFGEAEKGEFRVGHYLRGVDELADKLGHPPSDSQGLYLAIQTLLFSHDLVYYRVEDEGFSTGDYLFGLKELAETRSGVSAIGLPGVGNHEIIDASKPICHRQRSLLLFTEADLYDYLTEVVG